MTATCRTCPWFNDRPYFDPESTVGMTLTPSARALRFCDFRHPETDGGRARPSIIRDPDKDWCSHHPREQSDALLRMMGRDLKAYQAKTGRALDL